MFSGDLKLFSPPLGKNVIFIVLLLADCTESDRIMLFIMLCKKHRKSDLDRQSTDNQGVIVSLEAIIRHTCGNQACNTHPLQIHFLTVTFRN